MEMEIERTVGTACAADVDVDAWHANIPQGISRMLITAISPLGDGGYGGILGFGHAVFPATATAVAGLEKHKFVAGGRDDDGRGGASGCSICLQEFEEGEEVSVMPCSRAHEFHQNCITKWLGMRNTCPLCRHGLPAGVGEGQ